MIPGKASAHLNRGYFDRVYSFRVFLVTTNPGTIGNVLITWRLETSADILEKRALFFWWGAGTGFSVPRFWTRLPGSGPAVARKQKRKE
jgi:hypothetical protein